MRLDPHRLVMVQRAIAWRDAAIADGWHAEPTYPVSEPLERAARLRREGFQAQIITRIPMPSDRWSTLEGSVHLWGPDGLAITPPNVYAWEPIAAGVTTCRACKATGVITERVGFAGRVCRDCLPEQRRLVETPGWNN